MEKIHERGRMKQQQDVLIIDFGSQYVQLIARRIRENKVHSVVVPPDISLSEIKEMNPRGIIFSGGPSSVYDKGAPTFDKKVLSLGIPILGICYGMQLAGKLSGGTIRKSGKENMVARSLNLTEEIHSSKGYPQKASRG